MNRVVGTVKTKPISSVTKDVIRSYLIEKVLPEIRAKLSHDTKDVIFINKTMLSLTLTGWP